MSDMKRFNALKKVMAKPMTRQEYNDLRGFHDRPAYEDGSDDGYLIEDFNAAPNLEGWGGFVSWTPKVMFENQFYAADEQPVGVKCTAPQDPDHELTEDEVATLASGGSLCDCCEFVAGDGEHPIKEGDSVDFGTALHLMELGERVQRAGWNGKGMFVYIVPAASYPMQRNNLETMGGEFVDNMVPYGAYLAMKTAQGNVVPWLASQTDVLAKDWCLA